MILYLTYLKSLELTPVVIMCHFFMDQQSSAYSSHDFVMGRDNDFSTNLFLKCLDYTLIKSNPTLKYYRGLNILTQTNVIEVIAYQCLA